MSSNPVGRPRLFPDSDGRNVYVRVEEKDYQALERIAKDNDWRMADTLRAAISLYLKEAQRMERQRLKSKTERNRKLRRQLVECAALPDDQLEERFRKLVETTEPTA